ncbi:MAG: DUF4129 domain-containing protein [Chloroflexi bacterium]|nr:DUF4129 domain-containing protein [Chloroflexota bacterium]
MSSTLQSRRSPARFFSRINWRREALYLAAIGMETCLLAPCYLLVRAQGIRLVQGYPAAQAAAVQMPAVPMGIAVALLLAAMVYGLRGLYALELPLGRQQRLLAGLIVISWLASLWWSVGQGRPPWELGWVSAGLHDLTHALSLMPLALMNTAGVLVLWWRAITLAQRMISLWTVGLAFRAGLLLLVLAVAGMALFQPAWAPPFIVGYFFYSLLAVGLARIEELAEEGGAAGSGFSARWLIILTLASAALAGLGLLASSLYSIEGIRQVLIWLSPLWRFLESVFYFAFSLIARLLEPVLIWLIELVQSLFRALPAVDFQGVAEPPAMPTSQPGEASPMQRAVEEALRYGCVGGAFVAAILALLILLPQRLQRRPPVDETRESIWEGVDLAGAWNRGAGRLRELGEMVRQYGVGSSFLKALSVRRLYAQMCRLAGERGYRRSLSETPYEYLPTLGQAYPQGADEVQLITEAYVRAHYGELPTAESEWEAMRASWERLKALPSSSRAQGEAAAKR